MGSTVSIFANDWRFHISGLTGRLLGALWDIFQFWQMRESQHQRKWGKRVDKTKYGGCEAKEEREKEEEGEQYSVCRKSRAQGRRWEYKRCKLLLFIDNESHKPVCLRGAHVVAGR